MFGLQEGKSTLFELFDEYVMSTASEAWASAVYVFNILLGVQLQKYLRMTSDLKGIRREKLPPVLQLREEGANLM